MEKKFNKVVASLALVLVPAFSMAETMIFDTVTSYKSGKYNSSTADRNMSITGVEKDTGDTITAVFGYKNSNYNGSDANSICTPSVITAMEKPGRYYLHVSWDNDDDTYTHYDQVRYCMLELKAIPQ